MLFLDYFFPYRTRAVLALSQQRINSLSKMQETDKKEEKRFEGRTLNISKRENDALIEEIFQGNTSQIDELFFPKKMNEQTYVMKNMIKALIFKPDEILFKIDEVNLENTTISFKDISYNFYGLLGKIKWDLITLDQDELNEYARKMKNNEYPLYNVSYVPKCNYSPKAHLYAKLHDGEKLAISVYKNFGPDLNRFLRGQISFAQPENSKNDPTKLFKEFLTHISVLASALNRIPPSVNGYLYRCMSDPKLKEGVRLTDVISQKMKNREPFKEKGFTSMALYKPQKDFLGHSEENSCVKIYKNPELLAKDISAIGEYENELECVLLPNTKDLALREINYSNIDINLKGETNYKTHIYVTKLISKRQNVV